jgi:hypothetical protein
MGSIARDSGAISTIGIEIPANATAKIDVSTELAGHQAADTATEKGVALGTSKTQLARSSP